MQLPWGQMESQLPCALALLVGCSPSACSLKVTPNIVPGLDKEFSRTRGRSWWERGIEDCVQLRKASDLANNRACTIRPWFKAQRGMMRSEGASKLVDTSTCREGGAPQFHRDRGFCTQSPSRPCPLYPFTWLFICLLYNKRL